VKSTRSWLLALAGLLGCTPPPARLWLAGDVQVEAAPTPTLAALAPLEGAGVVNLEGPLLAGPPGGTDRLHNHLGVPAALRAVGVVAVSLANNHAADGGDAGLAATRIALQNHGLLSLEGTAKLEVDGHPLSLVAAYDTPPEALAAAVRAAPRPVVVSLHVLAPPAYAPAADTRARVEAALAAGAAVVAVHGSHALGKVERRGRQIVAWGLGNVAFSCRCTAEDEAMALEVTLDEGGVYEAFVVPLRAGLHGEPTQLEPEPKGVFDLLEALGSPKLTRRGVRASF